MPAMAGGVGAWLPLATLALALGVLLVAAMHDLRRFEIPDGLSVALIVLAVVRLAALPGFAPIPDGLWHLASGILVFALGAGLFAVGAMGGGDVKLLAALSLWVPLPGLWQLLAPVLVAGGVLAALLLVARGVVPVFVRGERPLPRLLKREAPLPYAVAIFAGGAVWAARTGFF